MKMPEVVDKKRIEYFDLMKGVCIALVVVTHCAEEFDLKLGGERVWSMLEHLRMPLYFFLSGMFFKEYSCFLDFVVRKFNKLIIPFAFFIVVALFPKLIIGEVELGLLPIKKYFTWMVKYGGYLWFLRSLFFANLLYYGYHRLVKKRKLCTQVAVLLILTAIGWGVNAFIPIEGDYRVTHTYITSAVTSFLVLPLFFVASNLRPILASLSKLKGWHLCCVFIGACIVWSVTSYGGVYLINAKVENKILLFYIAAFAGIACVWSICYAIKRLFFFSYLGRYSIIVYLTHLPLLVLLRYFFPELDVYELIVMVLLLMPLMIWFFKGVFPAFVAQRDIFIYENGRIKFNRAAFSLKKQ